MIHSFKLLKELLAHLSTKEVSLLAKRISTSQDKQHEKNSKSKHLVKLLLDNPDITAASVEKIVYGVENKIAFSKLIDRTIEKIDDIFITFNKDITSFNSERNYYYFSLKRKLLVLQMRWLRGIDYDLGLQFERIISLSQKYELYEILIDVLQAKQRYVGFRYGNKAFDKIEKEIVNYENTRKVVQRARSLFTKIATKIERSISYSQYQSELEKSISELTEDYSTTGAALVKYYLLYLQVEWFQNNKNKKDEKKTLLELENLVLNNKAVYTNARYGEVLMNLSSTKLILGNLNEALRIILGCEKLFDRNSVPYNVAKEIEFYCRFHLNEIEFAQKIIEKIHKTSNYNNVPLRFAKYSYLYACVKTLKGEIEKSNELLLQAKELDKNKGSWNIGKRVLTIINCIEAQDHEKAELQVMNLEKFIKRNSKVYPIRKREKLIMRILINLVNEGYDFDRVYKNRKRYLDLLESDDPDYEWKIKSPELIIFTEWFKKKMLE